MIAVADNTRSEEIAAIRKRLGLSVTKFAERLGAEHSTVHNWVYGKSNAVPDDVLQRARLLDSRSSDVGKPLAVAAQLLVPIPMIGALSASSVADWTDPMASEDWEYVPPEMAESRGRFAARVEGDSMFDLLWPDDVVIFQRHDTPKIGYVVLFRSFDNRITVKQLQHNGTDYVLRPLNRAYEDEIAKGSMIGYLVGVVRVQGSRRVTVYDPHGIRP